MPADAPLAPAARPGGPAIECEELVVRYGPVTAVAGLSFRAMPGEVLALLGPNGAGKTSTVESLEGYRRPASGRLRVLGLDPLTDHRALTPSIGAMLQRGGVYPMLGPRRVLRLFAAYYPEPEDPEALVELVGLREVADTPWRHLSGGEQQRLSLALALVGRPRVVFLDEPTAGVDPEGRLAVRAVIAGLADRGVCVLLTTHELGEAERLADQVVIVHRGRAAASGSVAELASGSVVSFGAPSGLDTAALSRTLGAAVTEGPPGRYLVAGEGTPALTAALTAWLARHDAPLSDLRTGRSLEDTYLAIVGAQGAASPGEPGGTANRGRRRARGGR
ncbi:MAG: ABC transporter ATP-binding protein [Acidimicrobiales bacterium]